MNYYCHFLLEALLKSTLRNPNCIQRIRELRSDSIIMWASLVLNLFILCYLLTLALVATTVLYSQLYVVIVALALFIWNYNWLNESEAKRPFKRPPRVGIVGAGISGICLGIKLKEAGVKNFR